MTKLYLLGPLLVFCSRSSATNVHTSASQDAIREAAALLQSVGVTDLCSPSSDDLVTFPRCEHHSQLRSKHTRRVLYDFHDSRPHSRWDYIRNTIGATVCVFSAALAAGLTIGLLSLDPIILLMKSRAATDENDRKQAECLLPLIQKRHLLLVTLLLLNTASSEALPMFLHGMFSEIVAVVIAIVCILVFAEIIPSALFTSSNQIAMAAACSGIVRFVMFVLYPLAYPISLCLDYLLEGNEESESSTYNRNELAALIRIQYDRRQATKERRRQVLREETSLQELPEYRSARDLLAAISGVDNGDGIVKDLRTHMRRSSSIHSDEVTMIQGALQMKTKCALDLALSHRKVYSISSDTILDKPTICKLFSSGYSRIPVYDKTNKTNILGILMTRQLILVNDTDNCPVSNLPLYVPHCIAPDMNLVDIINLFQTGGSHGRVGHMALVCAQPDIADKALANDEAVPNEAGWIGILTMEDCIEQLLQEPIMDEMDVAGRLTEIQEDEDEISCPLQVDNNYHPLA